MANFSEQQINQVFEKGIVSDKFDSKLYRLDVCGALIQRSKYGDRTHNRGWEIDHIKPASKGGTDDISNLQPLQWQNNANKADNPDSSDFCYVMLNPDTVE